jgi:hypothetical protein
MQQRSGNYRKPLLRAAPPAKTHPASMAAASRFESSCPVEIETATA